MNRESAKKKATKIKGDLVENNKDAGVNLNDLFPPLNHVSYEIFKIWKKESKAPKEGTKVHKL